MPTPVKAVQCTLMWISAARLSAEHSTDDILQSQEGDSQPAIWQDHWASLREFVRIPHQGISFLCTSDAALHSLGGLTLQVCGLAVHIRKYSKYDKLYFVDLHRLPGDVSYRVIYNWFVNYGFRPVRITPTTVAGELKSRDRTVYFHADKCPAGFFLIKIMIPFQRLSSSVKTSRVSSNIGFANSTVSILLRFVA